ncbi:MAG: hypothetical protein JO023_24455 [Chloroflexi bacterium]|nr:hypothetical protein [Chloroflexota bacterium]
MERQRATAPSRREVARAAERLYDGTASVGGRGLLLRGQEAAGVTRAALGPERALGVAANGLVRLARVAEHAAERLLDHPEPAVRRAAALLAAAAYPLLTGLEATPSMLPEGRVRPADVRREGTARRTEASLAGSDEAQRAPLGGASRAAAVTSDAAARAADHGTDGPRPTARPEDLDWLRALAGRSPVVTGERRRAHWQTLLPWLDTSERYAFAAALLEVEQQLGEAGAT